MHACALHMCRRKYPISQQSRFLISRWFQSLSLEVAVLGEMVLSPWKSLLQLADHMQLKGSATPKWSSECIVSLCNLDTVFIFRACLGS